MIAISRHLFTNNFFWPFVGSQSEKHRLTKLVIVRPLGKLDLGDQHRLDPLATLHHRRRNPEAPSAFALLRQVHKGTCGLPEALKLRVEICQELVRKTGADSAGEHEALRTLVTDQQRTKVAPASFRQCVTADYELLRLGNLEFLPRHRCADRFRRRNLAFWRPAPRGRILGQPGAVSPCCREAHRRSGCSQQLFQAI